jgi:hypothetical protein
MPETFGADFRGAPVITSAAKQSISPRRERVECFVRSPPSAKRWGGVGGGGCLSKLGCQRSKLIDTAHDFAISPRVFARGFFFSFPPSSQNEGAGKAGCALHPRSRVQRDRESAHEHTGSAEAVRPSLRNGFTAYVELSPAIGLSCHRRLRKLLPANLTPASRRQDHTILPSASKTLSSEAPLAATASSPAFVTIAIRPSSGVDGCGYKTDSLFRKTRIFFRKGLDR